MHFCHLIHLACLAALGAVSITVSAEPANELAVSKPDDGGLQQWTNSEGKTIDAHFLGVSGTVLTVSDEHGEKKIELASLSTASRAQAKELKELWGKIGVYQSIRNNNAGFDMGSPEGELGRGIDEVQRKVQTNACLLKASEVTWTEWNTVRKFADVYGYTDLSVGSNGHRGLDADFNPVVDITWWDAVKWCNLKSQLDKLTPVYHLDSKVFKIGTGRIQAYWHANGYRLPTEAEWEFACRTRNTKREFHTGSIKETGSKPLDTSLDKAGWYAGNSNGGPHRVALKDPNNFKLYDMHGNAAEWCWDYYTVWSKAEARNPRGPEIGEKRSIRGGSWADPASACRSAARASLYPIAKPDRMVGFRIARSDDK